jgi:hypothetical protein
MRDLTAVKLHCAVCNEPPVYEVFDVMLCGNCSNLVDLHRVQARAEMTQALIGLVVRLTPPVEHKP